MNFVYKCIINYLNSGVMVWVSDFESIDPGSNPFRAELSVTINKWSLVGVY